MRAARVGSLLATLLLAGCGGGESTDGESVVAAFYPLAWAAEEIGGAGLGVSNLTPAGAEPHDLELTPRQVDDVRDADLVLYLGDGFQPALERALEERDRPSLDLLRGQALAKASDDEEELTSDPHVWLDPVRFARMVAEIGRALDRTQAAGDVVDRLRELDHEYRDGLARCDRREIVTSHAAFGYLAARYGLGQVALTGLSPEAEPTPQALQDVIDEVRQSGATTVFFETLASPRLAETVAREADAKTAVLHPIEGLTDDELDAGEDYISIMRRNLAALREALGCA